MSDHTQADRDLFTARQEFLDWNRAQASPPVAIGKEYAVAEKLLELARRSIPQGEEPAKASAQGDELPPLPEWVLDNTRGSLVPRSKVIKAMREYGASCRSGEKADARDAAPEEAALAAEAVEDDFRERQGGKWPELRDDAETGASECVQAIRNLKSADAARSHTGGKEEGAPT